MKPDQKNIYYLTSESLEAARWSPHLEWFKKQDIEVILMADRIDEWLVGRMSTFKEITLLSATDHSVELPTADEAKEDNAQRDMTVVREKLKAYYGDKVQDVIESRRLMDSPVCLVKGTDQLAPHLVKMLREAGQSVPDQKMNLAINSAHPFIIRLADTDDEALFHDMAQVLLDQATLAEGGTLQHPMAFIQAINRLVSER
jgi:molecular chaperone HtpG